MVKKENFATECGQRRTNLVRKKALESRVLFVRLNGAVRVHLGGSDPRARSCSMRYMQCKPNRFTYTKRPCCLSVPLTVSKVITGGGQTAGRKGHWFLTTSAKLGLHLKAKCRWKSGRVDSLHWVLWRHHYIPSGLICWCSAAAKHRSDAMLTSSYIMIL